MRLGLLAEAAGVSGGIMDTEVLGIAYDSRRVRQGDLFIALRGGAYDGHAFIEDAIARGAAAVVHEGQMALSVPDVSVESSRHAMARISNTFYGYPSRALKVVGVTGTNGKTTTTRMIKSIIDHAGSSAGLIGTIEYDICGEVIPAPHTTPEAPEFQGLLARMRDAGCTHAVTEVSSHALMQSRVEGTEFKCRGIYEPHPRAPRLPPYYGRVLRCQGPALYGTADWHGGHQYRRPLRAQARGSAD